MNAAPTTWSPAAPVSAPRTAAIPAAIAAGVLLGSAYTLSPLTVWFVATSVLLVWAGGRGLPPREQRWVRGLLIAGLAVRVLLVGGLFLFGTPDHTWFSVFFGDEQYVLIRSLRLRDLWLRSPLSLEALSDIFDSYGQTSYLNVIAYAQLLAGPAPYGIHLLNATFYVAGVVGMHRLVRMAFGRVPAIAAMCGLLFYPTLLVWSASGLKESLNFLLVMGVMGAAIAVARAPWRWRLPAAIAVGAGIAALSTFRAGAAEMMAVGLASGLVLLIATRRRWRLVATAVAVVAFVVLVPRSERIQNLALRLLRPAARVHFGHVLTRGHSYKLLDQRLYESRPAIDTMTWDEGLRFVKRAAVSVVFFPTPWDAQSLAELAYLPEQMAWYVVLATAVVGVAAGLRRDPLVTLLFAAYASTALMVVALNTGNIGTLVRHRAFALPFLIALSALGATAIAGRLARSPSVSAA